LDSGERFSPGFLLTFQIVKMAKSSDWSARGLTIPVVIKCRKYSIDRRVVPIQNKGRMVSREELFKLVWSKPMK